MANFKVFKPATFSSAAQDHGATVYIDIRDNPGTTIANSRTRTGLSQLVHDNVLSMLLGQRLVVNPVDTANNVRLWASEIWYATLVSNLAAARTWLSTNDGGLASAMATALGVQEAVALELARMLEREETAKIVSV